MGFKPSGRDWVFFAGLFLSGGVVAITATMPLRVAKGEITGWPSREIGVFGQTTVAKTREIWSWWRKETCDKYIIAQDQLNSQTTVRIADVESDTHVAGIGQSCLTNRACRSHAAVRCYWYEQLEASQAVTLGSQIAGVILYAMGCVVVVVGINMRVAVAFSLCGAMLVMGGLWEFASKTDTFQNSIRTVVFWPYATLNGTFKGALALAFLACICAGTGTTLVFHQNPRTKSGEGEAGEQEEEEEEYYEDE
jgi:hypothetical protein